MRYLVRGVLLAGSIAGAALPGAPEFRLVIRDRRIAPAEIAVPAGQQIRLVVQNEDGAGDGVVTSVGPLEPGRYEFYGEFNARTERGWLVVRA
jgi:hypothetical protein